MALGAKGKGAIIVVSTLLVGMVLGSLMMGWFVRSRLRDIPNPRFFMRGTMRLIEPRDEVQEQQVRAILEAANPRFKTLDAQHHERLRTLMDSVHGELRPHLDAAQWQRLENRERHFRKMMGKWHRRQGGHRGHKDHKEHRGREEHKER